MITKGKIRDSLIKQLQFKGAKTEHFEDLIDDYLRFFDIKKQLQADIKQVGIKYKTYSAQGVASEKQNPSIKDLVAVNKQMLVILEKLDISTKNVPHDEDEL